MPVMVESQGTSPRLDWRVEHARTWLSELYPDIGRQWFPVAGDASFRRYFRVRVGDQSRIVMDAPPEQEPSAPFVDVCKRLRDAGLHAPEIFNYDLDRGYLLLEDLGDDLYRDVLHKDNVQNLFEETFYALVTMANEVDSKGLPLYSEDLLHDELNEYTDFYLGKHKNQILKHQQRVAWMTFCQELVQAALSQPQVFTHRDIHSNNLLRTETNSPGIIDFQDAVIGPVSHDLVSLIWDRYITWPRKDLEQWMDQFRLQAGLDIDPEKWIYFCDLMGLQRNLRIVGRFAFLQHVQNKDGFVEMIPRFYQYILDVLPRYPQFSEVLKWIGSDEFAP